MTDHDPMCWNLSETCCCDAIRAARADERERIAAACRMLLDSGDITPMGVRMLTTRDCHCDETFPDDTIRHTCPPAKGLVV